jgi:putative PIN family toxin of toxin-antitoxin system
LKRPPRVVLDTHLALSALVFREGRLAALRTAWQSGRCFPLATRATTEEFVRVLAYPKFRLSVAEQNDLLADYLPCCKAVAIPRRAPDVPKCPDPDDVAFLQLAVAGEADYLVTGDKALLGLTGRLSCPIVRPDAFIDALGQD